MIFDFPPTPSELADDAKRECLECGKKMKSFSNETEFWGVKATHIEYACECGCEEMV
jgi:hypothetical protein